MAYQVALAAKAIKAELKAAFPGITFSVTSESYTGGNAVNIQYQDGVMTAVIEAIVSKYQRDESTKGREDIPQAKCVFVRRVCSGITKLKLAFELDIPADKMECFNADKNEWNEALIWQVFCTRTFGHHPNLLGYSPRQISDDEPTVVLITEGDEVDLVGELFDNPDNLGNAAQISGVGIFQESDLSADLNPSNTFSLN